MNLLRKINHWYQGTPQEPYVEDLGAAALFIFQENKRHWSARVVRLFVTFYTREWKWLWAILFAIIGLFIAFKKL